MMEGRRFAGRSAGHPGWSPGARVLLTGTLTKDELVVKKRAMEVVERPCLNEEESGIRVPAARSVYILPSHTDVCGSKFSL